MSNGGVRRRDVFGRSVDDSSYYPLPLTGSGGAVLIQGSITTSEALNSTYEFGQITVVSSTATELVISISTRNITFQAPLSNSQTVFIGASNVSATGIELVAGDSLTVEFDDSNTSFYAFASSTSLINYMALA